MATTIKTEDIIGSISTRVNKEQIEIDRFNSSTISIPIADDEYIARSIKEANRDIDIRETEIFELEKKLLTLHGLKRQMDKKRELYIGDTSSTNGAG